MENKLVKKRVTEHIDAANLLLEDEKLLSGIGALAQEIIKSLKNRGKLIVMGNGGSAADAQHMAAEFTGRYLKEREPFAAIALSTNSSSVTAIGNDYGFENVFKRQVNALAGKSDVVLGISTSGNSENVVKALHEAKSIGAFTTAIVGTKKCKLDSVADLCIKAPGGSTPRIQEMHILIIHMVCEIVEQAMSG